MQSAPTDNIPLKSILKTNNYVQGAPTDMPGSGWLSSIARRLKRTPTPTSPASPAHVKNQDTQLEHDSHNQVPNCNKEPHHSPPSRPVTPWSLDTLDDEITTAQNGGGSRTSSPPDEGRSNTHRSTDTNRTFESDSTTAALSILPGGPRGGANGLSVPPPSGGGGRPQSAASRLFAPAEPLLRTQAEAHNTAHAYQQGLASTPTTPLPQQGNLELTSMEMTMSMTVDDSYNSQYTDDGRGSGTYSIPQMVTPLYARQQVGPTPSSTRCNTPVPDLDLEKRVRFLEPENFGVDLTCHNPRHCNCPCHFLPQERRSVGVQVRRGEKDPRPRGYRLMCIPSFKGLGSRNPATAILTFCARMMLSQVGLILVVIGWWVVGAVVFSHIEGPAESATIERMTEKRNNLIYELATELRQVIPHTILWVQKIEEYMNQLEYAVLEATRAGYGSSSPTWTMTGGLLYSASLTTLIGHGSMVVRTAFSQIFAIVFALVGAPLVLLLALSAAYTLRELFAKFWDWLLKITKQRKVQDSAAEAHSGHPYSGVGHPTSVSSLNLSAASGRPDSALQVEQAHGLVSGGRFNGPEPKQSKRVPSLDTTLRPPSASLTPKKTGHENNYRQKSDIEQGGQTVNGVAASLKGGLPPPPRPPRPRGAPWAFYLGVLVIYMLLGMAAFAAVQRANFPSTVYIVMGSLLNIDHAGLGAPHLVGSSLIIFPWVVYILLGTILIVAFLIAVWPSLCLSLLIVGKYLGVVKLQKR